MRIYSNQKVIYISSHAKSVFFFFFFTSAWAFNGDLCANAINLNVAFAGPYLFFDVFLAGFFVPFTYIPDLANDFGMSSSQVSDTYVDTAWM